MPKLLTLMIFVVFSLALLFGYLFLTEKIVAGEQQIAAGQKKLAEGQEKLERGKAKLAQGKRKLSQVNKLYTEVNDIPLMGVVGKLPVTGMILQGASRDIAKGKMQIAQGQIKVKAGEGQIAAGKMALSRGEERLSLANMIRLGCKLGAAFFATLALVFGFYWRRSLVKDFRCHCGFKRSKA